MFPKVNYVVRTTFCNLGLWNLDATYKNVTQYANAAGFTESDQWGLGQIFIRQNGLSIQWVVENGNYVAKISLQQADYTHGLWFRWFLAFAALSVIGLYVAILSRFKFRRIKEENDQFKKIKILTSNFELEVSEEFAEVFKAQQADQQFLSNKDGARTSAQVNIDNIVADRLSTPLHTQSQAVFFPDLNPKSGRSFNVPRSTMNASKKEIKDDEDKRLKED